MSHMSWSWLLNRRRFTYLFILFQFRKKERKKKKTHSCDKKICLHMIAVHLQYFKRFFFLFSYTTFDFNFIFSEQSSSTKPMQCSGKNCFLWDTWIMHALIQSLTITSVSLVPRWLTGNKLNNAPPTGWTNSLTFLLAILIHVLRSHLVFPHDSFT